VCDDDLLELPRFVTTQGLTILRSVDEKDDLYDIKSWLPDFSNAPPLAFSPNFGAESSMT